MNKQQLRDALSEKRCVVDTFDENPFVGIYLEDLYEILSQSKQQMIEKAVEWIEENTHTRNEGAKHFVVSEHEITKEVFIKKFKQAMMEE